MKVEIKITEAGKTTFQITGTASGGVFSKIEYQETASKGKGYYDGPQNRVIVDLMVGEPVGGVPGGRRPWLTVQSEHPKSTKPKKAPRKAPAKPRRKK